MLRQIIAVTNQKGGVGKTTTAVNLAASLIKSGRSVLLVDLDPQGNASSGLGIDNSVSPTMYELLLGHARLDEVVKETHIEGLYIVPANANLAAAEIELVDMDHREYRLRDSLKMAVYDYVIIDCPPALSLLTVNALSGASSILIPVQAEYYALEGLGQLLQTVQHVRGGLNPNLDLLGVVLTMFDKRTTLSDQVLAEVKKHFSDKVFKTVVPRNIRLAEAPSYGQTIFEHDKWSKGARAYKSLAKEVIQRVEH